MSIIYSLIARGPIILTEFTNSKGNFTQVTQVILEKIPPNDSKLTYVYDRYLFHYISEEGITYLCMADDSFGRRVPFAFLQDIKAKFLNNYTKDRVLSSPPYGLNEFSTILSKQMEYFSNNPAADKIKQALGSIEQNKEVLVHNIERVLQRGERIELLVDKTDNLNQQAFAFKKRSTALKLMGNNISSTTTSIATAGIDSYVSELGDIQYEKSLGSARFMKTICGRHKEGPVVVKIFIKPEPSLSLSNVVKTLKEEREALSEIPNAFPYQRIIETEKAGYLIRQHFFNSLYDRISTRPFLNLIEKKWITYQILCGIHDAHTKGIYHGDIKTENILVTSWNWVYLVDFAGYKPTYLPEDNPADFSFFFDTSSRRTCYLAPERFYKPGSEIDRKKSDLEFGEKDDALTPAMDIFSLGCVIAELFLEGTTIFSLSQLFKYRSGEYDPGIYIEKIEDPDIKAIIKHMINVEPSQRYSAEQYLQEWRGKAFPQYFYTFLHQYIGSSQTTNGSQNNYVFNTDADDKIERIYNEFDKIAFFLGFYGDNSEIILNHGHGDKIGESSRLIDATSNATSALPMNLHIPNYKPNSISNKQKNSNTDGGALIFISLICAMIRNTAYPSTKLHAMDMLLAFGQHLEDEFKLDRLVPYLISLLGDKVALVRANAVKTLSKLLFMVENITPSNATIFPEYIMLNLRKFPTDKEVLVRMTYAQHIASLAETALKFLELSQLLKTEETSNSLDNDADFENSYEKTSYDASLHELQSIIQEQVTTLLIDNESAVKRALLSNITSLCIFFGRQKANDVLLSHMITYLNDRDWMLRSAFFESIVGVGTFIGGCGLEEYILPLMIQSLSDTEEFVVEKVLNSLTSLAELRLFQKMKLWDLVAIVAPLLCHPGIWIRYGAIGFIASVAKLLPQTDIWCIIYPIIRQFLQADIVEITEMHLLENVKKPLSRAVFDSAVSWVGKANKSSFWRTAKEHKSNKTVTATLSSNASITSLLSRRTSTLTVNAEKVTKSEEDEIYFEKLRNIGMTHEDEEKLAYMRDYIYKFSILKSNARPRLDENIHLEDGSIASKDLGINPQNVFISFISPDVNSSNFNSNIIGTPNIYPSSSGKSSKVSLLLESTSTPRTPTTNLLPSDLTNAELSTTTTTNKRKNLEQFVSNTYEGNDRNVKNLLDSLYIKYFSEPMPEFGPSVTKAIVGKGSKGTGQIKTIASTLVAHITEHKASINQIRVSPDHNFVATCSDDGTVRIWDCGRFITFNCRSRITHIQKGKVKCMTFIDRTHSIASASDNGSIHIFRVECFTGSTPLKYGKAQIISKTQLNGEVGEYAVAMEHYESGTDSILLYATSKGNICGLDLRTMEIVWTFTNPRSYGVITAMVLDKKFRWLLTGTSRGILTLWDLRFRIQLRSWTHPSKSRISKLLIHPQAMTGRAWVVVSAGKNEISIWDIEKIACKEAFGVITDEKMGGVTLDMFKALDPPESSDILRNAFTANEKSISVDHSVRAVLYPQECNFIITAGSDRKIRFWDNANIKDSYIIAGSDISESKPVYSAKQFDGIKFYYETQNLFRNSNSTSSHSSSSHSNSSSFSSGRSNNSNHNKNSNAHKYNYNPSQLSAIQQQQILKNHLDCITDLAITEFPHPMLISGDRDGILKVFL
nr:2408_t:CDS:10 [Entrophospora candida]